MSTAIGQLLVRLRRDGLFSSDDIQTILRTAIANSAPALGAAMPRQASFVDALRRNYAAAE